jgi:hypothetical protein
MPRLSPTAIPIPLTQKKGVAAGEIAAAKRRPTPGRLGQLDQPTVQVKMGMTPPPAVLHAPPGEATPPPIVARAPIEPVIATTPGTTTATTPAPMPGMTPAEPAAVAQVPVVQPVIVAEPPVTEQPTLPTPSAEPPLAPYPAAQQMVASELEAATPAAPAFSAAPPEAEPSVVVDPTLTALPEPAIAPASLDAPLDGVSTFAPTLTPPPLGSDAPIPLRTRRGSGPAATTDGTAPAPRARRQTGGSPRLTPTSATAAFDDVEADFFAREADLYKREVVESFDDLDAPIANEPSTPSKHTRRKK